jgi:ACR3 family arsenite transporter
MVFVWSYLTEGDPAYTLVQVAVAITLFGAGSGAALATVVGVLVEVPGMLSVCNLCNRTRQWFAKA